MRVILRLPEVERRTGLSRSEIARLMKAGVFPKSVQITSRSIGWVEDEIDQYIEAKIAARDAGPPRAKGLQGAEG